MGEYQKGFSEEYSLLIWHDKPEQQQWKTLPHMGQNYHLLKFLDSLHCLQPWLLETLLEPKDLPSPQQCL